jgi:hypothetical protein
MWFDILLNSAFLYANRMWNVVPIERFGENVVVNFPGSQFQAQQASINKEESQLCWVTSGQETCQKRRVLTEEKLDGTGAGLEHTPQKSLRRLAQETGISKSSRAKATKLLQLRPYKATVVHALQPRDSANKINFCNWLMQTISDETWFHLHGHVSSQNNRYRSFFHEVPLHDVI